MSQNKIMIMALLFLLDVLVVSWLALTTGSIYGIIIFVVLLSLGILIFVVGLRKITR